MTPSKPAMRRGANDARSIAVRSRLGERQQESESSAPSSRPSLVPLEHAAEFLDADDLLAGGERLVDLGPVSGEGPIADAAA
ncbi:MAG: hypothetical protein KF847_08115 [Pirellulales bacterium]|nr:hypothetical protein [Pirellulales bacterium]